MPGFPKAQVIPLPGNQASFQVEGEEVLRYHFGPDLFKPYWFPLIGPSGAPVTRVGHPHDPVGHRHHRGIWIAHQFCNGVNFWEESDRAGKIVHDRIVKYDDGDAATMSTKSFWVAPGWATGPGSAGVRLAEEIREVKVTPLDHGERLIDFRLVYRPVEEKLVFGKTSFGFLAVRVAKTMSVNDGGGELTNSEGGLNEEGVFWRPSRWMDYSGQVKDGVWNGIAFLDHPSNHDHPATWHVRNDGWMSPAPCFKADIALKEKEQLALRYRLWVHEGSANAEKIEEHWKKFADAK